MKRMLLVLFLCVSVIATGCRKKEAEEAPIEGGVQTLQDTSHFEKQYKEVLAKDPDNYEAIVGLGNLYYDAGQSERAIEMYQKALSINPKDADVMTDMGTMYRKLGKFDKAVEEFKKAASTDPRHENSRYNLGVVLYYDKNDPKGAAAAWEDLLKVSPNHPNAEALRQMISQARSGQASKSPSEGWVK